MDYKFKLKKEKVEDGWSFRPKIKISLINKDKIKNLIAVIDTGSDLNYIPTELAEYFDLQLSSKEFTAQGAEQEFSYKTSKIVVKIDHPHKFYRKLVEVMVPTKNTMHKDVILGTEFLKDFILTIDYHKAILKLRENKATKG